MRLWVAVALVLIPVAFYWKLILTDQYTWLESPDLAHQVLPWFQYQAGEWQAGRFPAWAPFEWAGQPLVGQTQPGAVYPLNWALFLSPLRRGWLRVDLLNAYYVLLHGLALFFMYLLCRDLAISRLASVLGGLIFAFGGYVGTTDWPQMLNGAIWAPLMFRSHLRAARGIRPWTECAWMGGWLGMSWLSGHHQVPIFLTFTLSFSNLYMIWRGRLRWLPALTGGVIFLLVAAAQVLPASEYGPLARRWVGLDEPIGWKQKVPFFLHQQWGFQPLSVFGIIIPGMQLHTSAFVGVTALGLAFLGAAGRGYWVVLAAASLLYSLSQYGGVEGWLYSLLPMVEKARSPSMATVVFSLAIPVLAATGLDRIQEADHRRLRQILFAGGVAGLALYLALGWIRGIESIGDQRPVMTALVALTTAWVLASGVAWWRAPALVGLAYLELTLMAPFYHPNRFDTHPTFYLKNLSQHKDLVDYVRQQKEHPRVLIDDGALAYNFGDWHGVDVFGGYLASLTENLIQSDFGHPKIRQLMGVDFLLSRSPLSPEQTLAFEGARGVNVYRMPDPLPRTWIVHSAFPAANAPEALALIKNPAFDLRLGATTPADLPLERCRGGDRATLLRRDASRVLVAAETGCRGLLVLNEVAYPGWEVTIDGRPAPLLTVNLAQRGVVVDRGWHLVEFRYVPRRLWVGFALTILGTIAVALTSIMERRKSTA